MPQKPAGKDNCGLDRNHSHPIRALVVDDDQAVRKLVGSILAGGGYAVSHACDGEEALALAAQSQPDLILLDLTLPHVSGLEVCNELRRWFSGPILVLSGNGEEATIVKALDLGADDYLTKPFRSSELLARLRALVRRMRSTVAEAETLAIGELAIDFARRRIQRGDDEIRLTRTEFDIVAFLVRNLDRVVTADMILQQVWGPHHGEYAQTLRVHIGHIRKKIEDDPSSPRHLLTESGVGYRFRDPARSSAAASSP